MTEVLESVIEGHLVGRLQSYGFKVLKLTTPGSAGTPDRMILRPKWSPGAPWVIEVKRPKKHERRLQELVRIDWRERGVLVLDPVNTREQVALLTAKLMAICTAEAVYPKDVLTTGDMGSIL